MADISKVELPSGDIYNLKDQMVRESLFGEEIEDSDNTPYIFRALDTDITKTRNRENDTVVGGTIVWNQLMDYPTDRGTRTQNGVTVVDNQDGSYSVSTVAEGASANTTMRVCQTTSNVVLANHVYLKSGAKIQDGVLISDSYSTWNLITENAKLFKRDSNNGTNMNIYVKAGTIIATPVTIYPQFFDLTQMFGATLANYIYSLEQANAGDGVAWFKKLFLNDYYAYDAGTLQSVQTSAHKTVGFNQWNGTIIAGKRIKATTGGEETASRYSCSGYIDILPSMTYYLKNVCGNTYVSGCWYDSEKNRISSITIGNGEQVSGIVTSPDNARYFRFNVLNIHGYAETCVSLHWDGERDGEYEPYQAWNYPLDDSLTLRGVPRLDVNNKLYYDGDIYESNGTVTRRYAEVTLDGTETWVKSDIEGWFFATNVLPGVRTTVPSIGLIIGAVLRYQLYGFITQSTQLNSSVFNVDDIAVIQGNFERIWIRDKGYSTLEDFVAAVTASPISVVYELATSTTETADQYTNPQIIDGFSTEEYVDTGVEIGTRDVAIPVGHQTTYVSNFYSNLNSLPDIKEKSDGDQNKFLRADGTWSNPTVTYSLSLQGNRLILTSSTGEVSYVDLPVST